MNFITKKSFILLLLAVCLLVGFAYGIPARNGEPGCQTEEEITVKRYPHSSKTLFWECTALGAPAVLQSCPPAYGFLDPAKECVHFSMWYWTPYVPPPSAPVAAAAA